MYALYLSIIITYPLVQLLSFQNKELVSLGGDATLLSNGSGSVNIVPRHHAHCDASFLTLLDAPWNLWEEGRGERDGGGGMVEEGWGGGERIEREREGSECRGQGETTGRE